ncbi:MAG: phytanoyl-CoA dioxygenase [Ponticaulis sp.]|nr:phytanoyl-CoA dioxygenase [Ponticaulis sp.]
MNGPGARRSVRSLPDTAKGALQVLASRIQPESKPVRVVTFDKSEEANWALPWHRDFVITTADRQEVEGFSNWTRRNGVWHVRPPMALLEQMFFLRVLLDDTNEQSGDLEIVPTSHVGRHSRTAHEFDGDIEKASISTFGERGDILALHALILHRSAAAGARKARRAIRIDFSADALPEPLEWAD